jgi:2-hydroxycyclohexanecarboxyl-CoA dehydrogenase
VRLSGDQAAFVTGGASGIGLGLARALAAKGVRLVLADVDEDALRNAVAALSADGADVCSVTLDVREESGWREAARAAWAWAGDVQLLCNCAGVVFVGAFADQPTAAWRLTMAVNVDGAYLGIRAFLPQMLASGHPGRIVNVASLAGLWGEAKLAGYTASKFALVGLSEALQLELVRTQVGVSIVFPGPTRTNLGRSTRRLGEKTGLFEPAPPSPTDTAPTPLAARGMDPAAVGRCIVEGIEADEAYIITHPDWRPLLDARFDALGAAFRGPAEAGYADDPAAVLKIAQRIRVAFGRPDLPSVAQS